MMSIELYLNCKLDACVMMSMIEVFFLNFQILATYWTGVKTFDWGGGQIWPYCDHVIFKGKFRQLGVCCALSIKSLNFIHVENYSVNYHLAIFKKDLCSI